MKKLVLLSLLLACQSLYAAPAAKPSPVVKTQSSSKVPAKKAAAEKKNEKTNSVADKKAVKTAQKKAATVAAVKPERQKKTETAHNGRKDKASEKKHTLVKQEKPQKGSDKRQPASQKVVAQKTDKANHKKDKAGKKAPALFKKHETAAASGKGNPRSTLLNHGKKFIGTPYVWGGASPKGFDCSGLVHYLYQKQGVSIPRNSREQFSRLPVASNPQPGDLVFFRRNGVINHVGLYLGGGKMLHAPQTGSKVRIEDMGRPNWKRRYAGARRALKGEKTVIIASQSKKNAVVRDKRVAKRAQTNKEKAKVAAVLKKSKVVTARR